MFLYKEKATKSLKRLTTSKTKISNPKPIESTSPKKIIKALYDYKAKSNKELSFHAGDFFHVMSRENDLEWFEACNPLSYSKGLVPVPFFQIVIDKEKKMEDTGFTLGKKFKQQEHKKVPVYGVVIYDFKAERPDELEAHAGEAIVVIAQSNHEWFIAKPIGRLGGPGLIPISYVQLRDALTGQQVTNYPIPLMEDWKKNSIAYENANIPIYHDNRLSAMTSSTASSSLSSNSTFSTMNKRPAFVMSASVDSLVFQQDCYWFVIYARVSDGTYRLLYRLYQDFYEFQVNLIQLYPEEASSTKGKERVLPLMPAPVERVDEAIAAERQIDLDQYCKELLNLPRYITECDLVQSQLFGLHEGDIESEDDLRLHHQPQQQQQLGALLKIKIIHKNDIFAIKVPADCTLEYLKSKIYERIGMTCNVYYKNETTQIDEPLEGPLDMEGAFIQAVKKGKLTVLTK
ncbi:hypothetical protein K501DRAFT_257521 [Backusella circina FSU 941]|nr:hypothetical protein K501DRAFT_257521 [Backusella circina FSU 941]